MIGEYTLLTLLAIGIVIGLDLLVLRTRLLRTVGFWLSLGIMWSFQVAVDGWLTRLDAPIVLYADERFSGVRIFLDSPIEDFGFGFAMILATLMAWTVLGRRAGTGRAAGRSRPSPRSRIRQVDAAARQRPDAGGYGGDRETR